SSGGIFPRFVRLGARRRGRVRNPRPRLSFDPAPPPEFKGARRLVGTQDLAPTSPPPLHETPVVLGRVAADARLLDDSRGAGVAGVQDAELFELLGALER